MGVMPDGPGGVNPDARYGYTGNNGSISGAAGRTQDVVVRDLKDEYYGDDFGTNNPWDGVGKMPQGPLLWSVLNAIAKSILKLPATVWPNLNDLFDALEWVPNRITEHTEAIIALQDVAAAMNVTAAYVGDEQSMVSVPRMSLTMGTISGSNTPPKSRLYNDPVEFAGSGVFHHSTLPTFRPLAPKGSTIGTIYYAPIIADRAGKVTGFGWVGGADTSIFSIDWYEIALCALNPLTNMVQKAWTSGNIKDAEASVSNDDPDELFKVIDTLQKCKPGQILFGTFQEVAPGVLQTARTIGALPTARIRRTASPARLKAWSYTLPSYSMGIPSEVAFESLTLENGFCPYVGLQVSALTPEEAAA